MKVLEGVLVKSLPGHKKRGKKPFRALRAPQKIASSTGLAIETRLYLNTDDAAVVLALGELLTTCRNSDLVRAIAGVPWSERKAILTPLTSARWAGSITRDNNDQLRLSRDNLVRAISGWRRAAKTISKRLVLPIPVIAKGTPPPAQEQTAGPADLAQPIGPTALSDPGKAQGHKKITGYASQAERASKQVRQAHLEAQIAQAQRQLDSGAISICKGGKGFLDTRHHLAEADLTPDQWREQYTAKRRFLTADGETGKKWGNETVRVSPEGVISIKLPSALVKAALGNLGRGKDKTHYQLSTPVAFRYRRPDWLGQIGDNRPVSYTIRQDPLKLKWYLAASWTQQPISVSHSPGKPNILAVDTNADHFSARVIDPSGNPVGPAFNAPLLLKGRSSKARDGLIRAGLSSLIHYANLPCWKVGRVVLENLGFEGSKGREKFGHNKPFRKTISGFPTTITINRASSMFARAGLELWVVDPAYTSKWGARYWLTRLSSPTHQATTHEGAAVVIGRRLLGYRTRTRSGVGAREQRISSPSLPVAPSSGPNSLAAGKTTAPQPGVKRRLSKTSPGPQNQSTPPGDNRCRPDRYFTPDNSDVRFVRY